MDSPSGRFALFGCDVSSEDLVVARLPMCFTTRHDRILKELVVRRVQRAPAAAIVTRKKRAVNLWTEVLQAAK